MGFPPLVGFFAKLPLFTSARSSGNTVLVLVLAVNSAIAAVYYLRLVYLALIASGEGALNLYRHTVPLPRPRRLPRRDALVVMAVVPMSRHAAKAGGYRPISGSSR